jgi:sulfur carrier protein ThiS
MKVTLDGRAAKIAKASTVAELIASLGLSGEETLVKVNGKLSPNRARLSPKDEVKVLRVIFGG